VKEFYIKNEVDAEFGSFNVSLSVDIIWVNGLEKPRYPTAYPQQSQEMGADFDINLELM